MPEKLRRAETADAVPLARLAVDTWRAAYAALMPAALLSALELEQGEQRFRAALTPPLGRRGMWVAEEPGPGERRLAGYCSFGPCRDSFAPPEAGEVYALYVASERWRAGLGSALLARALADLAHHGLAPVSLWVLSDNARARAFYERQGFAVDPVRGHEVRKVLGFELEHARYVHP